MGGGGGGEGYSTFLGGGVPWDFKTLTLNQTKFSCILQPNTVLD